MNQPLPANDPQVLVMVANPEPDEVVAILDCHCSVGGAHPRRPVVADISEPQRGMSGIRLQEFEVPAGRLLH